MTPLFRNIALTFARTSCHGLAYAECNSGAAADIAVFVTDSMANVPTKALAADGTMKDAMCTHMKHISSIRRFIELPELTVAYNGISGNPAISVTFNK